ncbi:retrovirus-related pol polyprotein from transposon TNT 1-94 [Tanacetum coccineum]
MADLNIPVVQAPAVAPPTRTDDQILPLSKWVPIGKSNNGPSRSSWKSNGFNFQRHLRDALHITPPYIPTANDNNPYCGSTSSDITFLTDKKNLATAARGKKKTAHLLIPSVRFTKLIIHHLRTKHNIHPRTAPYEIKGAPYYGDYQEHVAKYQQFLDEECGKAKKGGATESSKATKVTKPKAAKATKPASDKAPKPTATQPPKPKPTPTQPSKAVSEKKCKLVKETPDEPSPAKRSKGGLVTKKRKLKSPLKLVDESSDEGVLVEEPAYNEEDANLQRALELSLMEQGAQNTGTSLSGGNKEPSQGESTLPEYKGKQEKRKSLENSYSPSTHPSDST